MSSYFKFIKSTSLKTITTKEKIPTSDLSFVVDGKLIQFKLIEEETKYNDIKLTNGVFTICQNNMGFYLEKSEFNKDNILDEFVHVEDLEKKVDCFFKNLHRYKEFGIEIPKRSMLLFGPAGSGKSTGIQKVIRKYQEDKETCVLIWNTDVIEASSIKKFFKYTDCSKIKKLILVAEDIGGIEADEVRIKSESSLLALLDNKDKSFKVPILILSTTNHPEIFMGNLTNRPDRFDDKIEMSFPNPEMRLRLYKFFTKEDPSEEESKLLTSDNCKEFTPAHIREINIRSAIYDKKRIDVIKDIIKDINFFKSGFTKKNKLGINSYYD